MVKLLIVDDHPIVREGLKTFLELQDDLTVVAEAGNLAQALSHAKALSPDLILLDVQLPDGNALASIPKFKALKPEPKVLILSSFIDEHYVRDALRLGASGYLLKHSGPKALLDYIRASLRGEIPLDPSAVNVLTQVNHDPMQDLTPREREVLLLISQGMSNKQIAKRMNVTEKTVKTHATHLFAKLGVRDRTQAALLAKERGY